MTSTVKVDNVQKVSDASNIIKKCGTTITLGASGDSVNLASGASQSGFGRTGTVDWITTPKVTGDSPVTAVSGNGYFLNTTSGTITVNLPAGSAGDIVSFSDYAATWQTYAVTLTPNGTEKIGGTNSNVALNTEGQSVTLIYVDSVQGWVNTMDSTSNVRGTSYITATVSGACNAITVAPDCANYKVATFKNPGTFCVSVAAGPSAEADFLIVGGGAGGGADWGGGAGAGGLRASATTFTNPPLAPSAPLTPTSGPTAVSARSMSVQGYPIVVGGGGAGGEENPPVAPSPGGVSSFDGVISAGGGGGGGSSSPGPNGYDGGSGGGARVHPAGGTGGTGNTPPVTPPQGNNGGPNPGAPKGPGGGGGGIAVGQSAPGYGPNGAGTGGIGGAGGGFPSAFGTNGEPCGAYRYFAGGGAGGTHGPSACAVAGGVGGGGDGGIGPAGAPGVPSNATDFTGGGGGGAPNCGSPNRDGGNGGSGIVVIRYRFQ